MKRLLIYNLNMVSDSFFEILDNEPSIDNLSKIFFSDKERSCFLRKQA